MADALDTTITEALRAWRVQHGAGIGVADALNSCATVCAQNAGRDCFLDAARLAASGEGIERLLKALAPVLPEGERAAIAAGWNGGRAEAVFDGIIAQRELWARTRARIHSRMFLPAAVLLIAVLIVPLPDLLSGGSFSTYLLSVAVPLAIAFFVWKSALGLLKARAWASLLQDGQPAPATRLDRWLLSLPLLRDIERQRCISDFSSLLSSLIGAGVPITQALTVCARTARNGIYRYAISGCVNTVKLGRPLSEAVTNPEVWPPGYSQSIRVGEESGALEQVLKREGDNARERYASAVEALSDWVPRFGYGIVALYIIYSIFSMVAKLSSFYTTALPFPPAG